MMAEIRKQGAHGRDAMLYGTIAKDVFNFFNSN